MMFYKILGFLVDIYMDSFEEITKILRESGLSDRQIQQAISIQKEKQWHSQIKPPSKKQQPRRITPPKKSELIKQRKVQNKQQLPQFFYQDSFLEQQLQAYKHLQSQIVLPKVSDSKPVINEDFYLRKVQVDRKKQKSAQSQIPQQYLSSEFLQQQYEIYQKMSLKKTQSEKLPMSSQSVSFEVILRPVKSSLKPQKIQEDEEEMLFQKQLEFIKQAQNRQLQQHQSLQIYKLSVNKEQEIPKFQPQQNTILNPSLKKHASVNQPSKNLSLQKQSSLQQFPNHGFTFLRPNFVNDFSINIGKQKNKETIIFAKSLKAQLRAVHLSESEIFVKIFQEKTPIMLNIKSGPIKVLQIYTANLQLKMQITSRQIKKMYTDQINKTIVLIFENSAKIFKKSQTISWDRIENIFAAIDLFKNWTIFRSMAFKRYMFELKCQNMFEVSKKMRQFYKNPDQIENVIQTFPIVDIEEFKSYNDQEFIQIFYFWKNKDPIKTFEIQYSLISLLYMNSLVTIQDIFRLARFIQTLKYQNIAHIAKAATGLHAHSISVQLKQKKSLIEIFKKKLSQQVDKKQSKSLSQNIIKTPSVKVTPSGIFPNGWSFDTRNRLSRHFRAYDHQFLKIQVTDDDFFKSQLFQCDQFLKPALKKMLTQIKILDYIFVPLSWTQSQLKGCSMWYTMQEGNQIPTIKRQRLIQFLGDFSKFQDNPALKTARMGQNLSTGEGVILQNVITKQIEDQMSPNGKYKFTDGIGLISTDLIKKIQKSLDTTSNIFQIRYQGSKGMLVQNNLLDNNTIVIRKSMKKFECPDRQAWKYLDVLAQNSYGPGVLNRQIIILLSANGIPTQKFIQIQRQFITTEIHQNKLMYQNFGGTIFELKKNVDIFHFQNVGELMNKLIKTNPDLIVEDPTLMTVLSEKQHFMFDRLIKKCHIKLDKSARLLGIIDQFGVLRQNEVYCTIKKPQEEQQNIVGEAFLTKNPCMHQADIRNVKCISKQEIGRRFKYGLEMPNHFLELINCIIFPVAGQIPLTSQISGSDLDGDQFYLCWDQRIVPKNTFKPFIMDQIQVKNRKWDNAGYDNMLNFFCEFIFNNELGRMANCHLVWADKFGINNNVCLKLCEDYSRALDYPKKGYQFEFNKQFWVKQYPHYFEKPQKQTYRSTSVLGRLYDDAKLQYQGFANIFSNRKYKNLCSKRIKNHYYTDNEIREAVETVKQYNKDMSKLMRKNDLERESQVHHSRGIKQANNFLFATNGLQMKYFNKFFTGLKIKKPIQFYKLIRENPQLKPGAEVQKKLLLWYQISNITHVNHGISDWQFKERIYKVGKVRQEEIKMCGLTWFCLPLLTYQMITQKD